MQTVAENLLVLVSLHVVAYNVMCYDILASY